MKISNTEFGRTGIGNLSPVTEIRGIPFARTSFETLLDALESVPEKSTSRYISITNTESLYFALRKPEHRLYVEGSDYSCCDGVAITLAARTSGFNIPRLHGPDLMLLACERGQENGWSHFFYGGKEGVPEQLAKNLKKAYPNMKIAGTLSPPFRALTSEEDQRVRDTIRESGADFVWVGLGLLKQEEWIAEHLEGTGARWMIGVGAAFDFYAGTVKRAPQAFRRLGLEWLYRAVLEPRMWVRIYRSLKVFSTIVLRPSIYRCVD